MGGNKRAIEAAADLLEPDGVDGHAVALPLRRLPEGLLRGRRLTRQPELLLQNAARGLRSQELALQVGLPGAGREGCGRTDGMAGEIRKSCACEADAQPGLEQSGDFPR